MQSNNPTLGDDWRPDEEQPDTGQPMADSQDDPELMATDDQPVLEDANSVPASASEPRAEDEPAAEDLSEDAGAQDEGVTGDR